jgi:ubiquinol-cytochrome c reductase iron-sulfur subunit
VNDTIAEVIGTNFIKKSLKTKILSEALAKRDEILDALANIEKLKLTNISDEVLNLFKDEDLSTEKLDQASHERSLQRRKVLIGLTSAVGIAGLPFAATPFIAAWNPSAKAKALGSSVKLDVSKMQYGQQIQVAWRKQPIFIIRHTSEALNQLDKSVPKLADPESLSIDEPYRGRFVTRSLNSEYSVLSGICTHLGCSPKYHPEVEPKPWDSSWNGGFFCPCHGSMFDLVGRVYKGVPAPSNLTVPPHFFEGSILTIGEERSNV